MTPQKPSAARGCALIARASSMTFAVSTASFRYSTAVLVGVWSTSTLLCVQMEYAMQLRGHCKLFRRSKTTARSPMYSGGVCNAMRLIRGKRLTGVRRLENLEVFQEQIF